MTLASSRGAVAQYDARQCAITISQLTEYMKAKAFKKIIRSAREVATYCTDDLALALDALATGLNGDNQHTEALAVADRCLQTNVAEVQFACYAERAEALQGLGRVAEAKATIESALRQPAITEWDVTIKQKLKGILSVLNNPIDFAQFGVPPGATRSASSRSPLTSRTDIPLANNGGVFVVSVEVNRAITLDFAIDSGAADVSIPLDVFSTLKRAGTIKELDILGEGMYVLADGSKSQSVRFRIRSLKVGGSVVENTTASVAPTGGMLLLGQSFLGRFKAWSIDNAKHTLVLEPR